jgi:hypothetical protein
MAHAELAHTVNTSKLGPIAKNFYNSEKC